MTGVPRFVPYTGVQREACATLFAENCPEYFAANERTEYLEFLDAIPRGYRVAVEDGRVIGAFGVIDEGRAGRRRLNWILIARDAQGKGLGAAMMAEARRVSREAGAAVMDIAASHKSAAFFARFGAGAVRETADGWGPDMHRIDMELALGATLLTCDGGSIEVPSLTLVSREDGGHLVVNPPRPVWERSELTREELTPWTLLVAATGRAMLDVLPQLAGGCINYWEAGNWTLHDMAEPRGRKDPRVHRQVHVHLLGRSPTAVHPSWQWGEAPRFPTFADRHAWSASFEPLTTEECDAIIRRTQQVLDTRYGMPPDGA